MMSESTSSVKLILFEILDFLSEVESHDAVDTHNIKFQRQLDKTLREQSDRP
jgi:hypothetical protein